MKVNLSSVDIVRIAAKAYRAPRTIARVYAGAPCEATTRASIERAATQLGLPPPPPETGGGRPDLGSAHISMRAAAGKL